MRYYSSEIKETMVTKLCTPGGPTYSQLALESGIALSTLHKWVNKAGVGPTNVKQLKRSQDWDVAQRLQAVFDAAHLNDIELGEFLRRNGLHSQDICRWKAEALAEAKNARGRPKLDPQVLACRKEIDALKKELRRKDKALAEAATLIVLKKRAEEFWSKYGDEESS